MEANPRDPAQVEPLSERFIEVHRRLVDLRMRIGMAQEKMRVGSYRARAAALRACISRIECWYGKTEGGRAFLNRIKISPNEGDAYEVTELRNEAMRRRGSRRRCRCG